MPLNSLKHDGTWFMVQPGCWIDPAGIGHVFPDEVIAEMQRQHPEMSFDPNDEADCALVVYIVTQQMQVMYPGVPVKIARHERLAH